MTAGGRVDLRMHVGVHSGDLDFFLVGEAHRELIVTGRHATRTVEMEAAGRKLLIKGFRIRRILDYGRFRRFETETQETVPPPGS